METLATAIEASWSAETSYCPDEWSRHNPARGQCVVTALLVQDLFAGDLQKYKTSFNNKSETHYSNLIDGEEFDLTRSQYPRYQDLRPVYIDEANQESLRAKLLTGGNTQARYELLRRQVIKQLIASRRLFGLVRGIDWQSR